MSYEKVSQVKSRLIIGTKQTLKAMEMAIPVKCTLPKMPMRMLLKKYSTSEELKSDAIRRFQEKAGAACGIEVGARRSRLENRKDALTSYFF